MLLFSFLILLQGFLAVTNASGDDAGKTGIKTSRNTLRRGVQINMQGRHLTRLHMNTMKGDPGFDDDKEQHRHLYKKGKGKGKGKGKKKKDKEDCVVDIETISTSVLLNFDGNPFNLDAAEFEAIGDVFEVAYNRLTEASCEGGSVRLVLDAVIQRDDALQLQRDLQLVGGGPKKVINVTIPFVGVINWQCGNCGDGDKRFFANDAARKLSEYHSNYYNAASSRSLWHDGFDGEVCAPCGLPSPAEFIITYNEVLQEFVDGGSVFDGITRLTSLNELEEVGCPDDVKLVQTTLSIDFFGDPSEASEEEMVLLEDSVAYTLNGVNSFNPNTCDPFFRYVVSAEADRDVFSTSTFPDRHLMLNFTNFTFKVIPFKTIFNIEFKCQGCPDDSKMFQNDAGRRQLLDTSLDTDNAPRLQAASVATLTEGCLCAVGADEFLPSTREEFDAAFNETMTALIAAEAINFIFQVGGVQELDEISCAAEVDSRESQLEIEGFGNPDDLTPADLTSIEEAIQKSLDTLYAQSCDPEVRVVLNVEIVSFSTPPIVDESDDVSDESDDVRRLQFSKPFKVTIKIEFSCKGCSNSPSTLFGKDAGRRLTDNEGTYLSVEDRSKDFRNLQLSAGEQCFCDVNVVDNPRTPTVDEFEALLAASIASLNLPVLFNTTTVSEETPDPTTLVPSTFAPTTLAPTTLAPTTLAPTTLAPTTLAPTTLAPTTLAPTTLAPTTLAPTTLAPTTLAPTTLAPTSLAPTPLASSTLDPTPLASRTLDPTAVPTTAPVALESDDVSSPVAITFG